MLIWVIIFVVRRNIGLLSVQRRERARLNRLNLAVLFIILKLSKNQKFGKMLIAISNGHKIRQVNITFIINNINSIFLDYVVISHIFRTTFILFVLMISILL